MKNENSGWYWVSITSSHYLTLVTCKKTKSMELNFLFKKAKFRYRDYLIVKGYNKTVSYLSSLPRWCRDFSSRVTRNAQVHSSMV